MSLVVAQSTAQGPRIVSDTHVLFPDSRRTRFESDTLKAVVLNRDLVLCFAGDVAVGLDAVRSFATGLEDGKSLEDLRGELEHTVKAARRGLEFILATFDTAAPLLRITAAGIERDVQMTWIGDQEGYEVFQRARVPQDPVWAEVERALPAPTQAMARLQRAMDSVIQNSSIGSVDGFCVSVALRPTGFEYLGSTFIYVGRDIQVRAGEDLVGKMAQPAEEGGYAVSVVEPADPGTPALGVNFPQARLGMVYLPLWFDEAQVIRDVSPNDFPRAVHERFGIAMKLPPLRYADN